MDKRTSAKGGPSLDRASEVFFAVRDLDPAAQDDAIARQCGQDQGLADLVRLLIRGENAPFPVETLADDIRAAHDMQTRTAPMRAGDSRTSDGSNIGAYRVLERLGEGGFGVVYLAEQERPVRRRVALKIIKLGMDTKQVVARFEAERQALAMMDHPGIAKVFDAGATETGRPYFVMELVLGLPITEYCDQKKLAIRERLELVAQVCDALQHAHQKGVIHRDVKPSNVLVAEVGDKAQPKIIDFGVAKATSVRLTDKTVYTELRQMIGTPEYMSPEQTGQSGAAVADVDTRTDVYSVGVLLYELLAGTTPFDSKRLRSAAYGEIQRIISEEDPPKPSTKVTIRPETLATIAQQRAMPPTKLRSTIRGELDWIVMKAIEKDRSRRYDSAGSMARDIRRYLAGEAVHAAPPSTGYLARKFARRNRVAVVASSLVLGALLAGLVGTSVGFANADKQRILAVAEKQRADAKTQEALASEAVARRTAYSASMISACQAMALQQPSVVRMHLDTAPAMMRGWEWRVLASRLDTSVRSFSCPMTSWKAAEVWFSNELLLHPDGQSFFTIRGYDIDAAQRWDLTTGELLARYPRPTDAAPDALSPTQGRLSVDGSNLALFCGALGSPHPSALAVWDLRNNSLLAQHNVPHMPAGEGLLAVSPDGSRVVRTHKDNGRVTLKDARTGATLATVDARLATHGTFSADGRLFAWSDEGGEIRVHNAMTLSPVATLLGHKNFVPSMGFSLDGRYLATASIDRTARIWDLAASPPSHVVLPHACTVEGLSLSADARLAATMGGDQAIRVWNASTGELLGQYSTERLVRAAVMVMPDGRSVAGRERDGTVRIWDISAETTVNLRGHKGYINAALLAERPGIIVSAGWDGWQGSTGSVRFWDADTGDEIATFGDPGEVAYVLAVSPDGRRAVTCLKSVPRPWTPDERQDELRLVLVDFEHASVVALNISDRGDPFDRAYGLAFDPSGEHFAIGRSGRIEIRNVVSGEIIRSRTFESTPRMVGPVAWSPDGRTIACLPTENLGIELSPEPSHLLDAQTLATKQTFNAGATFVLRFSGDSRTVFSGARDGLVRGFDVASGMQTSAFQAHDRLVSGIAASPDGTRLTTTGGDEGDIIVWDTTTPLPYKPVARFHEEGFVSGAIWDSSGQRLIAACDRTIRIWDDTPLRDRVAMREVRARALAKVTPLVDERTQSLGDHSLVVAALKKDQSLTAFERRVAMQVLLRRRFEALQGTSAASADAPGVDQPATSTETRGTP